MDQVVVYEALSRVIIILVAFLMIDMFEWDKFCIFENGRTDTGGITDKADGTRSDLCKVRT